MDLISIIIPVYNTGKYLTGCIDSCLNQTYSNLEIIVLDDRSTDPLTIELLNKYKEADPRIKVIFSDENRGQGYRRNEGLKYVQGKYFAYIDSDDTFVPNAIEHLHDVIVKYDTDFVLSDVHNIDAENVLEDRLGHTSESLATQCRDLFNFKGEADVVFDLPTIIRKGKLFTIPALCYGKLFNTERYLKANVRFDEGPYSRHCQDEDWSTSLVLKLKSFIFTKFVSIIRFILKKSASSPSLEYYKCAIAACSRRYNLVNHPFLPAYYRHSVMTFALERTFMLLNRASNTAEYKDLCLFAGNFIKGFCNTPHNSIHQGYTLPKNELGTSQQILSYAHPQRPSLIYWSLQNILDTSDPEILAVRCLLEHLASLGFKVCTINCNFTLGAKGALFADKLLLENNSHSQQELFDAALSITKLYHNGINHYTIPLSCNILGQENRLVIPNDARALNKALKKILPLERPDIFMFSGVDGFTSAVIKGLIQGNCPHLNAANNSPESQPQNDNGIRIVYLPLHNAERSPLPNCDLIATFSQPQAEAYQQLQGDNQHRSIKSLGYTPFPTWDLNSSLSQFINEFETPVGYTYLTPKQKALSQQDASKHHNVVEPTFSSTKDDTAPADAIDTNVISSQSYQVSAQDLNPDLINYPEQPKNILEIDSQRQSGAITLLYPELNQGLAIAVALILKFAESHPDQKFIFFSQNASALTAYLSKLHNQKGQTLSQLKPNLKNLQIKSGNEKMDAIYKQTKVMLHLPLSTLPDAMIPLYASWQGIKVLTSDQAHVTSTLCTSWPAELQAKAFSTVKLPESTLKDPSCLPSDAELEPMVKALEQLLTSEHVALSYTEQKAQIQSTVDNWHKALLDLIQNSYPKAIKEAIPQLYYLN